MMIRICSVIIVLTVSVCTLAGPTGRGEINFGFSKDKSEENFGSSGRYELKDNASNYSSYLNADFQFGSNEGRSIAATSSHQYQYVQSYMQVNGGTELTFKNPYFSWNNQFSYRRDYEQQDKDEQIATQYNKSDATWAVTVGPKFNYGKGSDIRIRSNIYVSHQDVVLSKSNELDSSVGIGKLISKFSFVFLDASKVCVKYKKSEIKDQCREDYTASFGSKKKNIEYTLSSGLSKDNDTETDIYDAGFKYSLSKSTELEMRVYRSVNKISALSGDELLVESSETQTSNGQSINYRYSWGRKRLEFKARNTTSQLDDEKFSRLDSAMYYEYELGHRICGSCRMEMSFEYSKSNIYSNKKISTVSLRRKHSKYWSTSLGFRESKEDTQNSLWSVNFLITYNGNITKFGY